MPRLENGELPPASKFKKRRAWIISDDAETTAKVIGISEPPIAEKRLERTLLSTSVEQGFDNKEMGEKHDQNKSVTRLEHDYNMVATRVEHDYNMSVTRLEQKKSHGSAIKSRPEPRLKHEYNKNKTRVEHDYNKSKTRVEHDRNKTDSDTEINNLFTSIESQRASIVNFDDDARSLILSLSDVHKRVFWHIAIECIKRNAPRTGPIEIKSFFEKLAISTPVVRTTLNRLTNKRIIQREKGKLGKNGFAIISLPKSMFDSAQEIWAIFNGL